MDPRSRIIQDALRLARQYGAASRGYADGGMPQAAPQPMPIPNDPVALARATIAARPASARLAKTFEQENQPGVIVSPRPGKGGGPTISPEPGFEYDPTAPVHESAEDPWSAATPNLLGAKLPPPVQHPALYEPRMGKLAEHAGKIFQNKKFQDFIEQHVGLRGLSIMPTVGTWNGEMEPSFIIQHPDMTPEQAHKLAHILGFGFQQDATVHVKHNPDAEQGIPALLAGTGKKLTRQQIDDIHDAARKEGLDFTVTGDGKAAKFLHFGDDKGYDDFLDKFTRIADANKLNERYHARTEGDVINAKDYFSGIFGGQSGGAGDTTGTARSPDLFRGIVDHILAPYAKAIAAEGYRLSPERLAQTYGLTPEETTHVRESLYPSGRKVDDRTTVPLMTGQEDLDVVPTGNRGQATVTDVLQALQNRAASKGQIQPGDHSDAVKKRIADDIAKEVSFHVANSDKSAIGWYDAALKKAMGRYAEIFPELETDKDSQMLFHAILGMTSQGNNVYDNSIHTARIYDKIRQGKTLPEALFELKSSFGSKTAAIEQNIDKFRHLIDTNGYDKMRDLFNQTKTASEWNKVLRQNKDLYGPDGKPLEMQGGKDQKVTGWTVFGPKIGSFINNLRGDYSTLTADLWFSRTWNRLLGHNFIHTPSAENKQYQDLRDAMKAEYYHHNGFPFEQQNPYKVSGGKMQMKDGEPKEWAYGNDMKNIKPEEFDDLINDPEKMLEFAQNAEESFRKGQYKEKSDVKRRAKNWIENRENTQDAPRGDVERSFQQDTAEAAQKLLKQKYGLDISIADIQAALWFHEKELFGKYGVASEKAQPADYEDAAKRTVELYKSGDLYRVKSKEKKPKKPKKGAEEPMARGGVPSPDRMMRVHPAMRIPGVHIRTAEAGDPIFHGDE
jgi:hypothetical protein